MAQLAMPNPDPPGAPSPAMPIPDIPLTSRPGADVIPNTLQLGPLFRKKTVLVVEDEPQMLEMLETILRTENYHVVPALTPEAAIAAVDGGLIPDLLITDVMMPGLSGIELAERIRTRVPRVPILYETGFSAVLFAGRPELESGAAFVEKPFSPRGLIEAARLALFGTFNP
jgi:DNA-binding response OmpR family regulator